MCSDAIFENDLKTSDEGEIIHRRNIIVSFMDIAVFELGDGTRDGIPARGQRTVRHFG